jgi:putative phosphoribosyl transferase
MVMGVASDPEPFKQFILKDRKEAGELLAKKLKSLNLRNPLVLAIPRGGVLVGYEITRSVKGELDIVTPRKLKDPTDSELAIGAVMPDGSTFLNDYVIVTRAVPLPYMVSTKSL